MNDKNILKFLIPLISVVVIFESVMLVSGLNKKQTNITAKKVVVENIEPSPVEKKALTEKKVDNVLGLVFSVDNREMKLNETYPVEINVIGKTKVNIDAIDLYVKYDSQAFNVGSLSFSSKLPKPTFSKVSSQKNVIVVNYLITETDGFMVNTDDIIPLLKFNVTPKKAGNFNFEINTSNEDNNSVTMFIENNSSKVLPFSSNKLNVNVVYRNEN